MVFIQFSKMRYALIAAISFFITACVTQDFTPEEKNRTLVGPGPVSSSLGVSYIKVKSTQDTVEGKRISLVGRVALGNALRRFLPEYHVLPMDSGVSMDREIEINAVSMPSNQFIQYLSALSGFDISDRETAAGRTLEIRSFITDEWMLGALTGGKKIALSSNASLNKGLDDEETTAALVENVSYDEWEYVLDAAKDIIGVDGSKNTGLKSYVYGSRSTGKIAAGGSAEAMDRLDLYLTGLEKSSTQQVAIEVQAFDVMLSDDRGSGVNWREFAALGASINDNPLSGSISNGGSSGGFLVPDALQNEGTWRGQFGFQSSRFSGQAVLQFLSRYGEVELLNQPNLTVRNGGFAIMHAGEQLSYIAETEIVRESDEDTVAVAASVKQLKVGVSLAVSPKMLDDKRILLNIWPVVSSIQGFDEFYSDPVPVRVPRLALQELSTEVIVESGKTIQLGGLIRKSMMESLQSLPYRDGISGTLLKPLFHADSKVLERRELVILVTPRLVNAGR